LCPRILPRFLLAKVLGVVLLTAAVFLSFSRAAWGNLAFAVLIYFFLNVNRVFQVKPGNLLKGGAITLLAAIFSLQVFERLLLSGKMSLREFLAWRTSPQDYDVYRFDRQKEGIEAGLTHWFGVGPGTWDYAHSLYVRTFAEHGILGLTSLLALIVVLMVSTFRRALDDIVKPYGLSAKVVLASLVVNSAVIDTIHWRHLWLILALAWVVCMPSSPGLSKESN
jgi:O-antigen ligase